MLGPFSFVPHPYEWFTFFNVSIDLSFEVYHAGSTTAKKGPCKKIPRKPTFPGEVLYCQKKSASVAVHQIPAELYRSFRCCRYPPLRTERISNTYPGKTRHRGRTDHFRELTTRNRITAVYSTRIRIGTNQRHSRLTS